MFASKRIEATQIASQAYLASFSFSIGELANREIWPTEVSFNSSGTLATFSPVPSYSSDFPKWEDSFNVNSWLNAGDNSSTTFFFNSIQIRQVEKSRNPNLSTGSYFLSQIRIAPTNLYLTSYSSLNSIGLNPNGNPLVIDSNPKTFPHALIITSQRCHLVWVGSDNKIYTRNWDGSTLSPITEFPSLSFIPKDVGIGGCVIVENGIEYPCFTTIVSGTNDVVLVLMTDSSVPSIVGIPKVKTLTSPQSVVAITQNPRTKKIHLGYLSGVTPATAKVLTGEYSTTGGWSWQGEVNISPVDSWRTDSGIGIVGLRNFENVAVMRKSSDNKVYDAIKRGMWYENQNQGIEGYVDVFSCQIGVRDAVGLLAFRSFKDYHLRYRFLDYPQEFSWEKSKKTLHIEGPPLLNTPVSIAVVFPEIATSASLVYSVVGGGSRVPIENATGVVISSGTLFTIAFDRPMLTASYPSWIGNQIKLLDINGNSIPLTYVSGTATEVHFITNIDLQYNATYSLGIASNVLDFLGTQLWGPATFVFTTQNTTTIPTGFSGIALFKDSLRTFPFSPYEEVSATATVYIRVTGIDGATQTQDVTTATLVLPWNGTISIPLLETASNSGGIYEGNFSLASIPIYNFPSPIPPIASTTLSWLTDGIPPKIATLVIRFPQWEPALSTVITTNGNTVASGASMVRLDSPITIAFSPPISSATINSAQLGLFLAGTSLVPASYQVDVHGNHVTITPTSLLQPESHYFVIASYTPNGLRNAVGNPLFRPFSFSFSTQASQTPPVSIISVNLFPDSTYNPLSALPDGSDFLAYGTIFIEFIGIDGASQTVDSTIALTSDGRTILLTETSINSGRYRGSVELSGVPDMTTFRITSQISPIASRTLFITYPKITPLDPASGATNVSIFSSIKVKASEELDSTSITSSTVKLLRSGTIIPASISYNNTSREITLIPTIPLLYNNVYYFEVTGVKDVVGNSLLSPLRFSFRTQPSMVPPTTITDLKVFRDAGYSIILASGTNLLPGQQIFVQIVANDLSPTTVDSTQALIQYSSGASQTIGLIETTPNSGIFRGAYNLLSIDDQRVWVSSQENPAFYIMFVIPNSPKVTLVTPASGSRNIALDTNFTIKTNKDIALGSISSFSIRLADNRGLLNPMIQVVNQRELRIIGDLAAGSPVYLEINNNLKDTDGLSFSKVNFQYQTVDVFFQPLRLFQDSNFSFLINNEEKVTPGKIIWVEAIGNDLRTGSLETIIGKFCTKNATWTFPLFETSSGVFRGSFVIPDAPGEDLQIFLEIFPTSSAKITISSDFELISIIPANGAAWVSADIWPTWTFSQKLDLNFIKPPFFQLIEVPTGEQVPGTLKTSLDGYQAFLQPQRLLKLLTEYELRVAPGIKDIYGRELKNPITTRFKTQGPPPPPSPILSLKNYKDASYTTETEITTDDGTLFIEVKATDPSNSTIEPSWVRIDSTDSRMRGIDLRLLETLPNSGVYRGSIKVASIAGATIVVTSRTDPNFSIEIKVQTRPTIIKISPASGSNDLYLDQDFNLSFSREISKRGLENGVTVFSSNGKPVSVIKILHPDFRTLTLIPEIGWATGTIHYISFNSNFTDTDGISIASTAIAFSTKAERVFGFELLSGISPLGGQNVANLGEAVPGMLQIIASTPKLFKNSKEVRKVRMFIENDSIETVLNEEPDFIQFKGFYKLPSLRGASCTALLLFADMPKINFKIAELPLLLRTNPSSGTVNVDETAVFSAHFSRFIDSKTASDALKILVGERNLPLKYLSFAPKTYSPEWVPLGGFPVGATVKIATTTLLDFLGQPVQIPEFYFQIGGKPGIQLYSDSNFRDLIVGDILINPEVYVELAVDKIPQDPMEKVKLRASPQLNASTPLLLELRQYLPNSPRFRGKLVFENTRGGIPTYSVLLVPGESLELSSPNLPGIRRLVYYKVKGASPPIKITGIELYKDKNFVQKLQEILIQKTIFVEITAEDRNWVVADYTGLKITSDSDPKGLEVKLIESGNHTGRFRGFVTIDRNITDQTRRFIKAKPGDRIYFVSSTDEKIKTYIKWHPEARLDNLVVWPNPTRGENVYFAFYLSCAADLEIFLYDSSGDEIGYIFHRGQEGENRVSWRIPPKLANGVYFFTVEILGWDEDLQTSKKKFKGKFAILR